MRLIQALGLLAFSTSVAGCGIITITTPKSSSEQSEPATAPKKAPEPEPEVVGQKAEQAMLAEAKTKLDAGEHDAAMLRAREVRDAIKATPKDKRDKGWHLIYAASIAVEGLAASGKASEEHRAVAALVAPGKDPFRGECFGDYVALCERYAELVADPSLRSMRRDGAVSSFYPGPLGRNGLNVDNLELVQTMLKGHPEFERVGLWISSSPGRVAMIPKGDSVVVKFAGSAVSWNDERCDQRIGRVKVGGQKFDVSRCRRVRESSAPANLTFTLPKDHGIDFEDPKRMVFVSFDAETFTRRGRTWDLGPAYAGGASPYSPRR
jgi:hypothetical protein